MPVGKEKTPAAMHSIPAGKEKTPAVIHSIPAGKKAGSSLGVAPEKTVLQPAILSSVYLSTAYLPPVDYVALWLHAGQLIIEKHEYAEKQSYRNRCRIATASGITGLSIPLERPQGNKTLICDVRLSDHGNWPAQHWRTIEASYQSSPFFDYLADDLEAIYRKPGTFLWDFNERMMHFITSWMDGLPQPEYTSGFRTSVDESPDMRNRIHPKKSDLFEEYPSYYQVFSSANGFIPNLSILDLLMNTGNEAILYLNNFKDRKFSVFL